MTSEVAGFTPEHEVQGSTRSRIRCIIVCVTLITLVGLIVVVTLAFTYATDPPGLLVHPDEVVILSGRFGENSGKEYNVDAMNFFADNYDKTHTQGGRHLTQCTFDNGRQRDTECIFQLEWVYGLCNKSDEWGYRNGKPCFLLTFNQPLDWVPEPYTSSYELPEEMPKSLRTHIEDSFNRNLPTQLLWVSCVGEASVDTENMGQVMLSPWQGFPSYYFPVRQDSDPNAIPVLALKLVGAQYDVLIGIRCHFWAKNLQPPHIAAHIELLV